MTPHLRRSHGFAVVHYGFTRDALNLEHHSQRRASLDFRSIKVNKRKLDNNKCGAKFKFVFFHVKSHLMISKVWITPKSAASLTSPLD
jgi:hypothetical protein